MSVAWVFLSELSATPTRVPTRDEILSAPCLFQGLTVQTRQYGELPLFDPLIAWLSGETARADRQAIYAVKRAAKCKSINLAVSGQYREARQAYVAIPGRDFTTDYPALRELLREIISEGFYVLLCCAGDGEGSGPGYNDLVGWTYGKQWLVDHFIDIRAAVGDDLAPFVIFCPGYDGVVPGWQPPQSVDPVLLHMRDVIGPSGYLALELSAGYASWGDGGDNWQSPAGQAVDLILQEFPLGPLPGNPPDQVWQIAGRTVRPYHRPPEQPVGDDPNPPFYLEHGTPRGDFFVWGFEYDTYLSVRRMISAEQVQIDRQYLRTLGYRYVG